MTIAVAKAIMEASEAEGHGKGGRVYLDALSGLAARNMQEMGRMYQDHQYGAMFRRRVTKLTISHIP
ncbi:MAG: hypothetical protein LBR80_04955 [Deltaproteobacteria bacterium]|jgi:hypothetical protein|nr:hypothetical protein [Deltaproteobacteria bacterium]